MNDGNNDLPVDGGEELTPTTIDITDADLGTGAVDVPAEGGDAAAGKDAGAADGDDDSQPRNRKENRIAEMRRREREATERAEREAAEKEQLRQQLQDAEMRAARADAAAMIHYEAVLKGQLSQAQQRLEDAISTGDSKKQAEATVEVSRLQGDLAGVEAWKASNPQPQPGQPVARQPQAQPQPQPQGRPQVVYKPDTKAWIDSNPWFQVDHEDYDPEMHSEAVQYAKVLESQYKRAGRASEIGGKDYFAKIDEHVRREFPEAFEDEPTPQRKLPPTSGGGGAVLAPGRTSAGGSESRATRTTRVELSAAERQIAHSMASSGAIKNADGSRMTPQQAERAYAVQKLKTQQQRSA